MGDVIALLILPICVYVQMRGVAVLTEQLGQAIVNWLARRHGVADMEAPAMRVVFEVEGIEFVCDVPAGCEQLVVPVLMPGGGFGARYYDNAHECVPRGDGLAVVFVPAEDQGESDD